MANPKTMELPTVPLRGAMLFPEMVLHFDIGRPRSIAALEATMMANQKIFLVAQKNEETEDPRPDQLRPVGTIAVVRQVMNLPGENVRVLVEGESRATLEAVVSEENYLLARVAVHRDKVTRSNEGKALVRTTQDLFE